MVTLTKKELNSIEEYTDQLKEKTTQIIIKVKKSMVMYSCEIIKLYSLITLFG